MSSRMVMGVVNQNPVTFDAVGAGKTANTGSAAWAHTIAAGANALIVFVHAGPASTSGAVTCKVGTTSMTQLGVLHNYGTSSLITLSLYVFGLLSPPTGAQTITATLTPSTSFTAANSVSYKNVSSFGTVATNNATGTAASLSVSSAVNQLVAQAFASTRNTSGGFTAYTQTSRYNANFGSSVNFPLVVGDAPGASTVSFGATTTSFPWAALGVPLIP